MSHRHINYSHHKISDLTVPLLLTLILINLVILNYIVFRGRNDPVVQYFTSQLPNFLTPTPQQIIPSPVPKQACPSGCLALIKKSTPSVRLSPQTTVATEVTTVFSGPKEFFIPLGAGENDTDQWEDVDGLEVYVDSTKYGIIKQAVFEASVRVPTKNQWVDVRLYNVTDKHPVWFSDVRFPGGSDAKMVTSSPMVLDSGSKLYRVQMKTQLKYKAYLDQSRIHITTP